MKLEYKSPVVTVEELTKVDVLCDSAPVTKKFYKENIKFDFSDLT